MACPQVRLRALDGRQIKSRSSRASAESPSLSGSEPELILCETSQSFIGPGATPPTIGAGSHPPSVRIVSDEGWPPTANDGLAHVWA